MRSEKTLLYLILDPVELIFQKWAQNKSRALFYRVSDGALEHLKSQQESIETESPEHVILQDRV